MKGSPRRLLLFAAAALALAALVAALALPVLVDADRYRGTIERHARQALGRDVRLGRLGLSLVPFGVRVAGLEIGARPGGGGESLLTAGNVRIGARLLPLLRRQLVVTSISVASPRAVVERGASRGSGDRAARRRAAPASASWSCGCRTRA
jgi:uncharacterized protein involved in outer membrane biogenesis